MSKYTRYHDGELKRCHFCDKPGVLIHEFLAISNFGSMMYFDFHKKCVSKARKERSESQKKMEKQGLEFTPYLFRKSV